MKAIAVRPGQPDSAHLADLAKPSLSDVADGRGVLVRVLRVGVDGTDREFAAAYAGVRLVLLVHYLRAFAIDEARGLTATYLPGHGIAALLWLASAVMPPAARLATWAVAFAIDLATPWFTVRHTVRVPPHPAHLPERFGLFTLILLGESVVAVMKGIESQDTWSPVAAASALSGMALLFAIWWWYFDVVKATAERPVRSSRDAVRLHVWSYAHFPLYLSIVVIGVGIRRVVTAATHATLPMSDAALWLTAMTVLVISMRAIGSSAPSARARTQHPAGTALDAFKPQFR